MEQDKIFYSPHKRCKTRLKKRNIMDLNRRFLAVRSFFYKELIQFSICVFETPFLYFSFIACKAPATVLIVRVAVLAVIITAVLTAHHPFYKTVLAETVERYLRLQT